MFRLTLFPRLLPLLAALLLSVVSRADDPSPTAPPATPPATLPATLPAVPAAAPAPPAAVPDQTAPSPAAAPDAPSAPLPLPAASPANPDEAFTRALTAYNAGAFEDARREFLAIVESGNLSAPLAHNLGNIEFRRGNSGQAVLWYKRAVALQPFSPETLQNLRTIRRQTAFLSFDRWGLSLSHLKSFGIENGTTLTAWVIGLLIVWLAWLTPKPGRRWPLVTLLVLLLPGLALGAFLTWRLRADALPLAKRQVVSGKETVAYAAPAEASSSIIPVPSGSEVVPLETRGNWLYCMIPGGEDNQPLRGWIRSANLEPLWPWPGGL